MSPLVCVYVHQSKAIEYAQDTKSPVLYYTVAMILIRYRLPLQVAKTERMRGG